MFDGARLGTRVGLLPPSVGVGLLVAGFDRPGGPGKREAARDGADSVRLVHDPLRGDGDVGRWDAIAPWSNVGESINGARQTIEGREQKLKCCHQ